MKLSKAQLEALKILQDFGGWRNSYRLRISLRTLEALEDRKLVKAERGQGSIWSPQTSTKWMITESGLEALKNAQE